VSADVSHYENPEQQYDVPVRMLDTSSRQQGNGMSMLGIAQMSAEAASRGLTSHRSSRLLQQLQTLGVKVGVEMFPAIVNEMHAVHVARIGEIVQQVRGLPSVQMATPVAGIRGMLGQQELHPQSPAYVSLDAVLGLLTAAQVDQNR